MKTNEVNNLKYLIMKTNEVLSQIEEGRINAKKAMPTYPLTIDFNIAEIYTGELIPDPSISNASYQVLEDKGDTELYFIPNRTAFFELIRDINKNIYDYIQSYLLIDTTPFDDATQDISNAFDLLNTLNKYIEII